MNASVILFDADGVLTLPEEMFAAVYAKSRDLSPKAFDRFFQNEWPLIVTGQKDLKESIIENHGLWQWDKSPEELLEYWFKTEDVRNEELLELISSLRKNGTPCYLATDQEKYRAQYMQNIMFKHVFDGHFTSGDLGVTKNRSSIL